MPQLISHRDGFGWQTPNTADIVTRPVQDEIQTQQLRGLATVLVRKFAELGTPVRLKDIERHSSHTRYHLLPDKLGGRNAERPVTLADLQAILPQLLEPLEDVQSAELVTLQPDSPVVTLFIRTSQHKPLSVAELLEHKSFLEAGGYTHIPLGMELGGKPFLGDVQALKQLMIVGQSTARLHLQLGIATTLMLFNSPSYLRIALVGDEQGLFRPLMGGPHILGNMVKNVVGFRRLVDGLLKHIAQRRTILQKEGVKGVDEYNKLALSNQALKPLPRIVVLLDTLSVTGWTSNQDWLVPFHQLLSRASDNGVHFVMTSAQYDTLPERLQADFPTRVVLRSALASSQAVSDQLPAHTPFNFIDGVYWKDETIIPLEISAVQEVEMIRLTTYWKNIQTRRNTDLQTRGEPAATGNTGLLTLRGDMLPAALKTATSVLTPITLEESPDEPANADIPLITDQMVGNARALAAYLGWLGLGPLQDVLNLTRTEAQETLNILLALGVLEEGEGPIWRFCRLADAPDLS